MLVLIVSLVVAHQILSTWRGITLYERDLSKERLLKAAQISPSNPDPFYRLGLFYEWSLRNIDLRESLKFLKEAIDRNPLEQQYWLHLAKVLGRLGEGDASEKALKKAILVFPTGYQGRWVAGTLLLQQGAMEKSIPHFTYTLEHYPSQSSLVYDVLYRAIPDTDFILERIVPKDPSSMNHYMAFLREVGDKGLVKKALERKVSLGLKSDPEETLRDIEFLIAHGELNEAFKIWRNDLREEGGPTPSDENLVTNGGFEREKLLGGGFDWRIGTVSGAKISFDHSMACEGKSSLKIVFDGKENVDFYHVYQIVPLKPNTEYVLHAHMKTLGVTTKSGLKIEVTGVGPAFHKASEPMTGENEWKELVVAFRTPAQSQGGLVRVRRESTDKFDRFISGTVWIDNVRLTEKSK